MPKGPKTHHVVPNQYGNWSVKKGGVKRSISNHSTKKEAVQRGRKISRNQGTELRIHNKDGKISKSDSHGNDPFLPRG